MSAPEPPTPPPDLFGLDPRDLLSRGVEAVPSRHSKNRWIRWLVLAVLVVTGAIWFWPLIPVHRGAKAVVLPQASTSILDTTPCPSATPDAGDPPRSVLAQLEMDRKALEARALRDDHEAQYQLGNIYKTARGVPRDNTKASEYYLLAANGGHLLARRALVVMLNSSIPHLAAPKDWATFFSWAREGAESGDANCQWLLGNIYLNGRGVPKDQKKAFYWFEKSALQNNVVGQESLACVLMSRGELEKSVFWFQKAAEGGYTVAKSHLGYDYLEGRGVPEDRERAFEWLQKTALDGYSIPRVTLALMYLHGGKTFPKDPASAVLLLHKADDSGEIAATYFLQCLEKGISDFPEKPADIFEYVKADANRGNVIAQVYMGDMCHYRTGGQGNPYEWFQKAASTGNALAEFYLGNMYWAGAGNENEASAMKRKVGREWIEKSAAQGEIRALKWLADIYAKEGEKDAAKLKAVRADVEHYQSNLPDVPVAEALTPHFYDEN